MEIFNETVYNSDDIRQAFEIMNQEAIKIAWRRQDIQQLRVGYYTPHPNVRKVMLSQRTKLVYVSMSDGSSKGSQGIPRFGLVRHTALYANNLETLASVADEELTLPRKVMEEVVIAFFRVFHATDINYHDDLRREILEKIKIRYSLRKARDAKGMANVRKMKKLQKLSKLDSEISELRREVRGHESAISFKNDKVSRLLTERRAFVQLHNLDA